METLTPLLEVRSLALSLGSVRVFEGVNFSVAPAQPLAVLGPSGCGKTSLLRLLAGFEAPEAGEIVFQGSVVSSAGCIIVPPHQRGLGLVFQDLALWPMLSVADQVGLGLAGLRLARAETARRVHAMLALCDLTTLAHRRPGGLSLGQQQRVALARGLVARPRLLLLDEPFSALDLMLKERLVAELERLARECDSTLLLVTHDPIEACALCVDAVVLEDGTVAESGRMEGLLANPRSRTLQAFRRQLRGPAGWLAQT